MDIGGDMQRDIYESMAAGVQGAAVMVPFLSRQYQLSEVWLVLRTCLSGPLLWASGCKYLSYSQLIFFFTDADIRHASHMAWQK